MSYSLDFRKHVFKIKEKDNLTFQELNKRFDVPLRTLFRWQKRIEPKTKRNKPATKVNMEELRKDVECNPDSYQYERAERLGVCQSAIFYALKRLSITVKKNAIPPES